MLRVGGQPTNRPATTSQIKIYQLTSSTQIYASQSVFHLFYLEDSLSIMKDGKQNELIGGKDLRKEKTSGNRAGSQENFLIY